VLGERELSISMARYSWAQTAEHQGVQGIMGFPPLHIKAPWSWRLPGCTPMLSACGEVGVVLLQVGHHGPCHLGI